MGLNSEGILQYVKGVENENLLFLEQPLRNDNLQGMAVVASKIGVPICADESVGSSADIMALRRSRAASGVNLKIIKFGGISQVVHASHICQEIGFSINLACKVAESSIAAAAISNLGFVLSNLDWGISMTNHYLSDDLVNTPICPANGVISVNSIPGLGVDVDEAKIRRYKI
jgi:L-alanine-DL-glutamate epimerase-like enolase superfamily enzyme